MIASANNGATLTTSMRSVRPIGAGIVSVTKMRSITEALIWSSASPAKIPCVAARIEQAMRETAAGHLRRVEPGLPLLATIGSTAPFIGLLGTVWGIMHSFAGIAASNDTSLAVVAPGIAEALFATAIGLVAAIPAVMAYNKLATDLGRLGQRLDSTITRVGAELSRERPVGTFQAAE